MSGLNQIVPLLNPIQFQFEQHFELPHEEDPEVADCFSDSFTVPDYGNEEWYLHLSSYVPNQWRLYLIYLGEPKEFSIDLMFTISNHLTPGHSFSAKYSGPLSKKTGSDTFITDSGVRKLVNPFSNKLHVICNFKLTPPPPAIIEPPFKLPECDVAHDLGSLYNDGMTADVTLTAKEKKFHAHRVILTARSSYFANLFKEDWKETTIKEVDATDMDANILEQVLRFIYTDQIPDLKESNAINLLDAATRYDLQKLKIMCEQTLCENVNIENAAKMLLIADQHKAQQWRTQTWRFIESHRAEIINTDGYKNLEEQRPELILELELFEGLASPS